MQNQRIMLTRRLLKEALLRLLESAPLDKISVTQLCQEAGVNRATFYRHYTSQEDVLQEIQLILQIAQRSLDAEKHPS